MNRDLIFASYEAFGDKTPQTYDCGSLCNAACCHCETEVQGGVVENGDIISINIPENTITLKVDDAILEERMKNFVPKTKELSGYLKRYANMVSSGAEGAILK